MEMTVTMVPHDKDGVSSFDFCRAVRVLTPIIMRDLTSGEAEYREEQDKKGPDNGRAFTVRWRFQES